jgi:hypothetical protein
VGACFLGAAAGQRQATVEGKGRRTVVDVRRAAAICVYPHLSGFKSLLIQEALLDA